MVSRIFFCTIEGAVDNPIARPTVFATLDRHIKQSLSLFAVPRETRSHHKKQRPSSDRWALASSFASAAKAASVGNGKTPYSGWDDALLYFISVACPPRMWRCALLSSKTARTSVANAALACGRRSTMSLCTLDFDTPKRVAACRTVAPVSTMYAPIVWQRSLMYSCKLLTPLPWLCTCV